MRRVSWLSVAPVKGLGLVHPREIDLGPDGVAENRRFYLVDEAGERYSVLGDGRLLQIQPDYDSAQKRLSLRFPDGTVAEGEIVLAEAVRTRFFDHSISGRMVEGPWAAAVSRFVGCPVRLVKADRPGGGVDRERGPVSLVSEASLAELGRHGGLAEPADGRRFRMLIGVEGCEPHEEDAWCGGHVVVGDAIVRLLEPVARCAITTRNPVTGERDFDTLRTIKDYRGLRDGQYLDFGVFGVVAQPGRVRVGDLVHPAGEDEPVEIVEYDSAWPARFEAEREQLERALAEVIHGGVHHVGSTAVPGLPAKPIVDVMVGVRDLQEARGSFDALAELGYCYFPYREWMHWFCKPSPERRTHHLHLVPTNHPEFRARLAFRDFLRESPDTAAEYAELKRRLACEHRHDREAYTEAKGEFVRGVLERLPSGSDAVTKV